MVLTHLEHDKFGKLKKGYKDCMVSWRLKADVNGYADRGKMHIKVLIERNLEEMKTTNVIIYG